MIEESVVQPAIVLHRVSRRLNWRLEWQTKVVEVWHHIHDTTRQTDRDRSDSDRYPTFAMSWCKEPGLERPYERTFAWDFLVSNCETTCAMTSGMKGTI